jgi:hypothetical protein
MTFRPDSVKATETVSLASVTIIFISVILALALGIRALPAKRDDEKAA